jgi:hypothetical protein
VVAGPLLTNDEQAAIQLTVDLVNALGAIVRNGPTRQADLNELFAHVHAVQNAIMAQAAARAYPEQYRLLGSIVGGWGDE